MARPKYIEDSKAIDLIKQYFNCECNGDGNKLNTTSIVVYISQHGYPEYNAAILRRSSNVMAYIEELKKAADSEDYVTTASYQTIDAPSFVDRHRSRDSLIKAITERDTYYKTIADAATRSLERYGSIVKKYEDEVAKRENLEAKIKKDNELIKEYESLISQLKKDLKAYKAVIDTYVYPEIANELLVKEGAIKLTKNIVDQDVVSTMTIKTETDIRKLPASHNANSSDNGSGSNIISNLFI
ncbi:MAG: hypothetical protein J5943_10620 [Oribacterium sp.]|nr:hypothetical protein [Oribacterium sp.]